MKNTLLAGMLALNGCPKIPDWEVCFEEDAHVGDMTMGFATSYFGHQIQDILADRFEETCGKTYELDVTSRTPSVFWDKVALKTMVDFGSCGLEERDFLSKLNLFFGEKIFDIVTKDWAFSGDYLVCDQDVSDTCVEPDPNDHACLEVFADNVLPLMIYDKASSMSCEEFQAFPKNKRSL